MSKAHSILYAKSNTQSKQVKASQSKVKERSKKGQRKVKEGSKKGQRKVKERSKKVIAIGKEEKYFVRSISKKKLNGKTPSKPVFPSSWRGWWGADERSASVLGIVLLLGSSHSRGRL
jgi:hypothetical protein